MKKQRASLLYRLMIKDVMMQVLTGKSFTYSIER